MKLTLLKWNSIILFSRINLGLMGNDRIGIPEMGFRKFTPFAIPKSIWLPILYRHSPQKSMTVLPEFSKISCKLQIRMIVILGFSAFVPTVSVKTGNASKIRRQKHRQGGAYMPKRGENIYKRKDGRWEGRYIRGRSPSGRAEYGYVYAGSYRECRAKRQKCLVTSVAIFKRMSR